MPTRRDFIKTASLLCATGTATHADAASTDVLRWNRDISVRYECDVAVLGGGMAGVSAALSAARSGARVILVEEFGVVGGNATIGGVGAFCGETKGQGEAFDAIVQGLEAFDAIESYRPYPDADNRKFDHEILAVVLQEVLLKRGVRLLLHTQFVDVSMDGKRIAACVVCGPSGPEGLRAGQYIDCTGEAQLTHRAGFATMKGRPEDGLQLPMSLMYFVRHADSADARAQVPEGWFDAIRTQDDLPMTSVWPNGPRGNAIKIKVPKYDATDTESLTAAEIRARRRMMEVLDYHQRVEKKPWLLDHCSPRIGIREGRRIAGEYVLTVDDLRAGRSFDDAVARGVYALDGHKPDDDKRTYILPPEQRKVPPYQIPYRCLIPRDSENLLAAGRCLSADQLATSSARVMTSCSMMGQAVGVAAALAAQEKRRPRDVEARRVADILRERGANLEI